MSEREDEPQDVADNPSSINTEGRYMADTSNVTQMNNRTFSGTEVVGVITAILHSGGILVHQGNTWRLELDQDIPGFDVNRTYGSAQEAATFLMGFLFNNNAYQGVIGRLAA